MQGILTMYINCNTKNIFIPLDLLKSTRKFLLHAIVLKLCFKLTLIRKIKYSTEKKKNFSEKLILMTTDCLALRIFCLEFCHLGLRNQYF